ncbi:MAG: hypothetical protein AAFV88_17850 [Planctomycetota bacterium]
MERVAAGRQKDHLHVFVDQCGPAVVKILSKPFERAVAGWYDSVFAAFDLADDDLTPKRWKADYMVVDDVLEPGGSTFERTSLVVESGVAQIQTA